jgi:hypothetical protein
VTETKSDEILTRAARYQQKERQADSWGRIISVQRLKQSQMSKIEGLTSDLQGMTKIVDEATGKETQLPRNWRMILAAHVREIDDNPLPFPKNREELDAILDRLDEEGLVAAASAFAKLNTVSESSLDVVDEAKNVVRTPRPAKHSA